MESSRSVMNGIFTLIYAPEDEAYALRLLKKIRSFNLPRKYRKQCPDARFRLACSSACSLVAEDVLQQVQDAKHLGILCTPSLKRSYEGLASQCIESFTAQSPNARDRIVPVIHLSLGATGDAERGHDNPAIESCMPRLLLADEEAGRELVLGTCVQKKGEQRVLCDVAASILGVQIIHLPIHPTIKASLVVMLLLVLLFGLICAYLKANRVALVPGLQLLARGIVPMTYEKQLQHYASEKDREMVDLLLSAYLENPESLKKIAFGENQPDAALASVLRMHYREKWKTLLPDTDEAVLVKLKPEDWERLIKERETDLLEELLLAGVDVNEPMLQNGYHPLHYAVATGYSEAVRLLQRFGARLSLPDADGRLPVDYVAGKDVAELLKNHAQERLRMALGVSVTAHNYQSLLAKVPKEQFISTYSAMLTAGFDMSYHSPQAENPLVTCARVGRLDSVKFLVLRETSEVILNAALVAAARAGHENVISDLLRAGADVDTEDDGVPVLMIAINSGNKECVKAMLDAEPKPKIDCRTATTKEGVIAFAANNGRYEMIEMLKEYGADMAAKSPITGYTPLASSALLSVNPESAVKALLECGADINEQSGSMEQTALMVAVERSLGGENLVRCLLQCKPGPDLEIKDKLGRTALMLAVEGNKLEIVKLLLEAKASTSSGTENKSILYSAVTADWALDMVSPNKAKQRNLGIISLLIDAKANPNEKVYGSTALDAALSMNRMETAMILLQNGAELGQCSGSGAMALAWAEFYDNGEVLNALNAQKPATEVREAAKHYLKMLHEMQSIRKSQDPVQPRREINTTTSSGVYREYKGGKEVLRLYGSKDEPRMQAEGYAGIRFEYDKSGNVVRKVFLDERKEPCMQPEGYAAMRSEYDNQNRITLHQYLDEAGTVVVPKDGIAQIRYIYEQARMQWIFLDAEGHLVNCPAGFALQDIVTNKVGKPVEISYFDTTGQRVELPDGTYRKVYEYDEEGINRLKTKFYGKDGSLLRIE